MVADQNVAEKRKEEAERMSAEVNKQQQEINTRKDKAQRDLDEAEPALRSAQASVRGIKKRDLDEGGYELNILNFETSTNVSLTNFC